MQLPSLAHSVSALTVLLSPCHPTVRDSASSLLFHTIEHNPIGSERLLNRVIDALRTQTTAVYALELIYLMLLRDSVRKHLLHHICAVDKTRLLYYFRSIAYILSKHLHTFPQEIAIEIQAAVDPYILKAISSPQSHPSTLQVAAFDASIALNCHLKQISLDLSLQNATIWTPSLANTLSILSVWLLQASLESRQTILQMLYKQRRWTFTSPVTNALSEDLDNVILARIVLNGESRKVVLHTLSILNISKLLRSMDNPLCLEIVTLLLRKCLWREIFPDILAWLRNCGKLYGVIDVVGVSCKVRVRNPKELLQ